MKRNSKKFKGHLKEIGFKKGYDKRRENNQSGQFKKGHKTNVGKKKEPHSKSTKTKMSDARKKYYARGNHPWNWRGKSSLNRRLREIIEYKIWRSKVFERDNWTCQTCRKRGVYLEAHHKKEFIKIIKEFKIKTIEQARKCKELWDVDNGVTLCKNCHNLTKKGQPIKFIMGVK